MSLQLHLDPSVAEHPQYKPLIENASRDLQETVRPPSDDRVDATWKSVADHPGRELIVLTLRDEHRNASAYFSPEDFRDRRDMQLRYLHLYGNLLDLRLRDQISNL